METITILEPILFTTISEDKIYSAPASEINKFVGYICATHDLIYKRQKDFNKGLEILIKSVKFN